MALDAAQAYCLGQGQDLEGARLTVAEARKRITIAADFARDEQLGKAVMRLSMLDEGMRRIVESVDASAEDPQEGGPA